MGEERDEEKRDLSSDAEIIVARTTSNMKKGDLSSFVVARTTGRVTKTALLS